MARGIYKALNIEAGEGTSVMFMIFQSVFLGIFYGTFDISASAMFLDAFPADMIPKAFLVSGIVGIIMTSAYTWLQSRIRFSHFAVFNLFVVVALTVLMRGGFMFTRSDWHIFLVFVMMGPLNIIALLGFWGTAGRMFTLRQGKRLFGLIDTGQIIGIILSSYAIPVLLSFQFQTRDLLYISAVSVIIALLLQIVISGRFSLDRKAETETGTEWSGTGFFAMFKDRYIRIMSIFFALLIAVSIIVHFIFYAVIKENYPDPIDLAAFLGYFNGTLMIFSILIKTFVYGWLMKTWGLRVSLAISPIMIILFTFVAAVIGSVFGYTALAAGFTFFFLVIAISKLFAKSLQDSIVAPSMKLLYQSLDINIRYNIQARIDGTINEIAVLLSSLALAGLGAVSFFGLIHITYFLIGILIVWAVVAFRLYSAYRDSLNESLFKFRQSGETPGQKDFREVLDGVMQQDSEPAILNALNLIERIDFSGFINALTRLLESSSQKIRSISLRKILEEDIPVTGNELLERIRGEKTGENRAIAHHILNRPGLAVKGKMSREEMLAMARSASVKDRLSAGMALLQVDRFDHHAVLSNLLRDPDKAVKNLAIQAAKTWKVTGTVPVLIDLLSTEYYKQAFEALEKIGESAIEQLEQYYYKSGVTQQSMNRVTRVIGKIGGEDAIASLENKINHQNGEVEDYALQALKSMDYQASDRVLPAILDRLRLAVHQIAWYLAAEYTAGEHLAGEPIQDAVAEELQKARDRMYLLLSLAYDPKSIYHIRENLESGTSEGIGFAIELLDIFVAEEIKPVLFPVLDDTSTAEKIRQLQVEFPIEILEPYELLIRMINRDPNLVGPVTKATAIHALNKQEGVPVTDDLIAQVFNPDDLLNELAALHIAQRDPGALEKILERLPEEKKNQLQKVIPQATEGKEVLIWDKIRFIRKVPWFAGANSMLHHRIAVHTGQVEPGKGDSIRITGSAAGTGLVIVRDGDVSLNLNNRKLCKLSARDMAGVLPFVIAEKDVLEIRADRSSILYTMTQDELDELVFDYEEMAMLMYQWGGEQLNRTGKLAKEMAS